MKLPLWKRHNTYLLLSLLVVLLSWFYLRPLNSPWQPFIAGDGLGYYAYLPAKFIHNDPQLDFKWFNKVYQANYSVSSFENPEDNFLVNWQQKRINKYYTGLSVLWFPFFVGGHLVAKIFHYPPDGFSAPYQWAIALASIVYLLLGLFFLRKTLLLLFHQNWLATLTPLLLFFGTWLFGYAVFSNSLSHVYSFCMSNGFIFFMLRFFREPQFKTRHLTWAFSFFALSVCIRPLNGLLIFGVPALVPASFQLRQLVLERFAIRHLLVLLIGLAAIVWQLYIAVLQTGECLPYTYNGEHFDFTKVRFGDALISYHQGLFVYAPILVLALGGFLVFNRKASLCLVILFFAVIYLYSAWWYWPILKRVMVDWYFIPAIGLGALFNSIKHKSLRVYTLVISLLCVSYFQLKDFQFRKGILDEFLTDNELYWRNFFRIQPASIYAIPLKSIDGLQQHWQNFEENANWCRRAEDIVFEGKYALQLDSACYIASIATYNFPAIFLKDGIKKLRVSLAVYPENKASQAQVLIKLLAKDGTELKVYPFYMNEDHLQAGQWDKKEFGITFEQADLSADRSMDRVEILVWNVAARHRLLIDDVKTEFVITNNYFETIK